MTTITAGGNNGNINCKEFFKKTSNAVGVGLAEVCTLGGVKKVGDVIMDVFDIMGKCGAPILAELNAALKAVKLIISIPDAIKKLDSLIGKGKAFMTECAAKIAEKVMDFFSVCFFTLKAVADCVKFVGMMVPGAKILLSATKGIPVLGTISTSLASLGVTCSIACGGIKLSNLKKKLVEEKAKKEAALKDQANLGTNHDEIRNRLAAKNCADSDKAVARTNQLNESINRWKAAMSATPQVALEQLQNKYSGKIAEIKKAKKLTFSNKREIRRLERKHKDLEKVLAGSSSKICALKKRAQNKLKSKENKWSVEQRNILRCNNYQALLQGPDGVAKVVAYRAENAAREYENVQKDQKRAIFTIVLDVISIVSLVFAVTTLIAGGFTTLPFALVVTGAAVLLLSDSLGLAKLLVDKLAWQKKEAKPFPMVPAAAMA